MSQWANAFFEQLLFHHPRIGIVFGRVSLRQSLCPVRALNFKTLDLYKYLVYGHVFKIGYLCQVRVSR